jgi:hypothetical protein
MAQGKPWLTRLGERLEQAGQPSAELVTTCVEGHCHYATAMNGQ